MPGRMMAQNDRRLATWTLRLKLLLATPLVLGLSCSESSGHIIDRTFHLRGWKHSVSSTLGWQPLEVRIEYLDWPEELEGPPPLDAWVLLALEPGSDQWHRITGFENCVESSKYFKNDYLRPPGVRRAAFHFVFGNDEYRPESPSFELPRGSVLRFDCANEVWKDAWVIAKLVAQ